MWNFIKGVKNPNLKRIVQRKNTNGIHFMIRRNGSELSKKAGKPFKCFGRV
jgi:hypothetical protein